MARKYVKKPVEVEAIQWTGMNFKEISMFCGDNVALFANQPVISTLEGDMVVSVGDYVIKGTKGEFYPCKPDIFELTYEEVLND